MKIIEVEGNEVKVDDEDYLFLKSFYNLKMSGKYIYCSPKYKRMGLPSKQLQKVLMNPDETGRGINVDHIDGNELNNQKSNLRVCTHQENSRNRKITTVYMGETPTSKYKGVYWDKRSQTWRAYINKEADKFGFIGKFDDELAAANCYNYWAAELFGEFAKLNDCEYMPYDTWYNKQHKKNKTSEYIGVSFVKNKWLAQIYYEGKNLKVGSFSSEEEAAQAYNNKALELRGIRAKINKIVVKN